MVGAQGRHRLRQVQVQLGATVAEELQGGVAGVAHELAQVDVGVVPLGVAGFDLGHVEHLVHQARQAHRLGDDDAEEALAVLDVDVGVVEHHLGERADRGQRRAQLVRHRGHEVVLEAVELLQLLVGGAQLGGGGLERARLLLELVRVGPHLRGLVEDVHDLAKAERLRLHHGRHHHPRRGAADGAGEQGLGEVHQLGVGLELGDLLQAVRARVGAEGLLGAALAEEARHQRHQLAGLGAGAPEARRRRVAAPEHVHEERTLGRLGPGRHA